MYLRFDYKIGFVHYALFFIYLHLLLAGFEPMPSIMLRSRVCQRTHMHALYWSCDLLPDIACSILFSVAMWQRCLKNLATCVGFTLVEKILLPMGTWPMSCVKWWLFFYQLRPGLFDRGVFWLWVLVVLRECCRDDWQVSEGTCVEVCEAQAS